MMELNKEEIIKDGKNLFSVFVCWVAWYMSSECLM